MVIPRNAIIAAACLAALLQAAPVRADQPPAAGRGEAGTFSACGVLVIDEAGRIRTLWADLEERRQPKITRRPAAARPDGLPLREHGR